MIELPLFPLNTVLFPSTPMRLHIFEERYKTMINECIENEAPFGIVLIEEGEEALGDLAHPHLIGTTARIAEVEKLAFGRMNITVIGEDRFRIMSLHNKRPFLVGKVDIIPFIVDDNKVARRGKAQLNMLLKRYLASLGDIGVVFDEERIPDDPLELAYLAAYVLQTDLAQKQKFLESANTTQLFKQLIQAYRREVALFERLMRPPAIPQSETPFSLN